MTTFTQNYIDLLIKQYWEQPNATAEIDAQVATWEKIRDILADFDTEFDVDTAIGAQLDIIGKTVGLIRTSRPEFATDSEYRFFIKLAVAKNNGSGFMVTDDRASIQDVVLYAFDGLAYVIDKKNMHLHLYIQPGFDPVRLALILELGLLPKPQGVRYSLIIQAEAGTTFGFSNNLDALGFDSAFDVAYTGGLFARKVFT